MFKPDKYKKKEKAEKVPEQKVEETFENPEVEEEIEEQEDYSSDDKAKETSSQEGKLSMQEVLDMIEGHLIRATQLFQLLKG